MPSNARKITTDTAFLFLGKVVSLALGLVRLKYIAVYLGVELYGVFAFAVGFVSMFSILFDLGLPQILTREIAADVSRTRRYLYNALVLKLILIACTSVLILVVTFASDFPAIKNWAVLFTVLSMAAASLTMNFTNAFQAHRRMKLVSLFMLLSDISTSIVIILLLVAGLSLFAVLVGTCVVAIANFALNAAAARKLLQFEMGGGTDRNLWASLWKESYPLAISSAGIALYFNLSSSILAYLKGDTIVGYYGAALRIITFLTVIPGSFTQVMYPIMAETHAAGSSKVRKLLEDSVRYMLIVSLPVSAGTILIAGKLIATLFTHSFLEAVLPLRIMMLGVIFSFSNWVLMAFLTSINRQRFLMILTIVLGILVATSNLLLIPPYGILVPSLALALTEAAIFVGCFVYLRRIGYALSPVTLFAKPALATLVMGVAVYLSAGLPMSAQIVIGIAVYPAAFLAFRGITEQDRALLAVVLPQKLAKVLLK